MSERAVVHAPARWASCGAAEGLSATLQSTGERGVYVIPSKTFHRDSGEMVYEDERRDAAASEVLDLLYSCPDAADLDTLAVEAVFQTLVMMQTSSVITAVQVGFVCREAGRIRFPFQSRRVHYMEVSKVCG